jgi:sporulation protein YlmC with PRC-barrel domain
VRLSTLLGMRVTTPSGRSLGRVFDVRAELGDDGLRLTGLVVGRLGLLERLGIGAPGRRERLRRDDVVPWSDVLEAGPHAVVVRDPQP